MDIAKEAARKGAAEGTIIVADEQTEGKGRLQRQWLSPPGCGIALSVILRPSLAQLRGLTMVASLATLHAVEDSTGLKAAIKWPNDVLVAGKKICGILIDSELQGERVSWAVIGLGLNVNFDPGAYAEVRSIATSLSAELGQEVSRVEVLRNLLEQLEKYYVALRLGQSLHKEWRARLDTLGRWVRVGMADRVEEGQACGVDDDGSLILKRTDGSLVSIVAGDVTLRA